jgi:hypothetical protein
MPTPSVGWFHRNFVFFTLRSAVVFAHQSCRVLGAATIRDIVGEPPIMQERSGKDERKRRSEVELGFRPVTTGQDE